MLFCVLFKKSVGFLGGAGGAQWLILIKNPQQCFFFFSSYEICQTAWFHVILLNYSNYLFTQSKIWQMSHSRIQALFFS